MVPAKPPPPRNGSGRFGDARCLSGYLGLARTVSSIASSSSLDDVSGFGAMLADEGLRAVMDEAGVTGPPEVWVAG